MTALEPKDLIPILVAILSATLSFIFGKFSEKNKVYLDNSKNGLKLIIARMYKELIDITNVNDYNIRKIKEFIKYYSSNENISLLVNDEVIHELYELSIMINKDVISNQDLKQKFYNFSLKIEELFWDLLKASFNDYKWWIEKKSSSKWRRYFVSLTILFKESYEYLTFTLTLISLYTIIDQLSFSTIQEEVRILIYLFTIIIGITYVLISFIYIMVLSEKDIKRRKLIKKL